MSWFWGQCPPLNQTNNSSNIFEPSCIIMPHLNTCLLFLVLHKITDYTVHLMLFPNSISQTFPDQFALVVSFVFLLWSRLSARSFSWLSDSISSAGSDFWISIYLGVYRFAYFAWFSAVKDSSIDDLVKHSLSQWVSESKTKTKTKTMRAIYWFSDTIDYSWQIEKL